MPNPIRHGLISNIGIEGLQLTHAGSGHVHFRPPNGGLGQLWAATTIDDDLFAFLNEDNARWLGPNTHGDIEATAETRGQ
jgi:hypothetical protein